MAITTSAAGFPEYLSDYGQFYDHLQGILTNLNNTEKGKRFADFARTLIKVSEYGKQFERFDLQQPSHDGGVDIIASAYESEEILYVQSKYTISSADDIDSIISKFRDYESSRHDITKIDKPQMALGLHYEDDTVNERPKTSVYLIFTASLLTGTDKLKNFADSNRPSRRFYDMLRSEQRLILMDGKDVLRSAQAAYRKSHFLPTDVEIVFQGSWISSNNVYVGILPGSELTKLYEEYGDALFLENIRSWLGPTSGLVPKSGRESVNQAIAETIAHAPTKFLSRNNGITFRSGKVTVVNENTLKLDEASIVNGCQTTMSIVTSPAGPSNTQILVKVVETDDAWDIAGSANFQTKVDRIDLDVAKYVRTQALREVADKYGYQLLIGSNIPPSIFSVFESISQSDIQEGEIKATFIGLFSRNPNNAVMENYAELNSSMLDSYAHDPDKEWFMSTLFKINELSRQASNALYQSGSLPDTLKTYFKRFWLEETGKSQQYRAYLSILALCDLIRTNIFESKYRTYESLRDSLQVTRRLLDEDPGNYRNAYARAFRAMAVHLLDPKKDPDEIAQHMSRYVETANFEVLFMAVGAFHMDK